MRRFSVMFVFHSYFSEKCGIIARRNSQMRLPHFPSRKTLSEGKQDEKVFTEAGELALLRLQQCIADLRISVPTMREAPRGLQPLRKLTDLF